MKTMTVLWFILIAVKFTFLPNNLFIVKELTSMSTVEKLYTINKKLAKGVG